MRPKFANRRQRFLVQAEVRANKVLNAIRVLGHCSNKALYDYKDNEIERVFTAIQKRLDETKLLFSKRRVTFKL